MLKCRDVPELASAYLDHDLPRRTWLAVRWHLVVCRLCRRYLDQLRKTTRLLRSGDLGPAAPEVEEKLIGELHRSESPPRSP
jgi:predicted anti-sigma-YlaC factor YlaD